MDRSEAKVKLENGDYILRNGQGKADFWKAYQKLFTKEGIETDCVRCQHCGRFDEYDTSKGLKKLTNHVKVCKAFGVPTLDNYIQRDIRLSKGEKDELTNAAVKFCYKDMRPSIAIEGKGLCNLLEVVSAISAKYGKLNSEQLKGMLPVANTVINSQLILLIFFAEKGNFPSINLCR